MPDLDRRLLYVLQRAARAALGRANDGVWDLGVSIEQLATLSYVAENPGCAMTELAEVLDLNKSAVSSMIARLERAELLERAPNPRDGRGMRLSVTRAGHEKRAKARPVFRRVMAELTHGFTEHEVTVVLRFLNATAERFGRSQDD